MKLDSKEQFSTYVDKELSVFLQTEVVAFLIERGFIKKDSLYALTEYALWFLAKTVGEQLETGEPQDAIITEEPDNGIDGRILSLEQRLDAFAEHLGIVDAGIANLQTLENSVNKLVEQIKRVGKTEADLKEELKNDNEQTGSNPGHEGSPEKDNPSGKEKKPKRGPGRPRKRGSRK